MKKKILVLLLIASLIVMSLFAVTEACNHQKRSLALDNGVYYNAYVKAIQFNFWQIDSEYGVMISFDTNFRTFVAKTMGGSSSSVGAVYSNNGITTMNNILQTSYSDGQNLESSAGYYLYNHNTYHFKASTAGGDSATRETLTGEWFAFVIRNGNVWLYGSNGHHIRTINNFWYSLDNGETWLCYK